VSDFDKSVGGDQVQELISDLESVAEQAPVSVAAVYILKNELAPSDETAPRRDLLFDRKFVLPGNLGRRWHGWRKAGLWKTAREWLAGRDAGTFRDRCDESFWRDIVPVVEANFDELAEPIMNTVNETIINYAEYSFRRWALWRRVEVHLFRTEGNLAYAIVRPLGTRFRYFDPLELRTATDDTILDHKRGWGHTLVMQRALFVSFDQAQKMRGMMIIVGPDEME